MVSLKGTRAAFTLIELLVVIAIIAILAVVVVLTLNPAQLLAQSRDANRVSDMATLSSAINIYETDQVGTSAYTIGTANTVYTSIPDASSTACANVGLITLPSGYSYHCATPANFRAASSSGWIPVDFSRISSGAPFGSVPIDPVNSSSSRLYYTYTANGAGQYELTAPMESAKYQLGGSGDVISGDGAPLASVYAKGTNLTLEPLDYGDSSLLGYWPLSEGSGNAAYDGSGNNATGTWNGNQSSPNGTHYVSGPNGQSYAGYFDGSTDYINVGNYGGLEPNVFTVTAWVKYQVTSSTSPDLITFSNSTIPAIYYATSLSRWIVELGASNFRYFNSSPVNAMDGNWHLLAFVVTGNGQNDILNASMYVDGQQETAYNTVNSGTTLAKSGFFIGKNSSSYFGGSVGNVRVYGRDLSAAQIQSMYSAGK